MDIKYLNYILAMASHHNMTKAAEDLFVSQSSLSQYLSRLEQELGTPLFNRSKGELTLTPAGELYVEAAKKVVKIQKELYQNITSLSKRGKICVGVTSDFGLRILSEIIPYFKNLYPEFAIEITESSLPGLKRLLEDGAIHVGIAAEVSTAAFGGQSRLLRKEEVFFAVPSSHPYASSHTSGSAITAEEFVESFSQENFLLSKKGSSIRMLSDSFFESCSFSPSAFCETNSITAIRRMISQNAGVAFISESCSVNRRQIAYYRLSPALYRLNLVICQKNWGVNEPEQVFLDCILNYFNKNSQNPYLSENNDMSQGS